MARTRSFQAVNTGSGHDLVMTHFRLRLKATSKPKRTRNEFDCEKPKETAVAIAFKAKIGGEFAPLSVLEEDDKETLNDFSTTVTDTEARAILGKHPQKTTLLITNELLAMCDQRRGPTKAKSNPEGADKYREINKEVGRGTKEADKNWIRLREQCSATEDNLKKNKSKETL